MNPPVRAAAEAAPCWASVCEYDAAMDGPARSRRATFTIVKSTIVMKYVTTSSVNATRQLDARRVHQAMAEVAAQWDRRLAAIKRLAEAAHAENQRTQPS